MQNLTIGSQMCDQVQEFFAFKEKDVKNTYRNVTHCGIIHDVRPNKLFAKN